MKRRHHCSHLGIGEALLFIALLSSPSQRGVELCVSSDHQRTMELCFCALLSPPLCTMELSSSHCSYPLHDKRWSPAPHLLVFLPHFPFGLGGFSPTSLTSLSTSSHQFLVFLLSSPWVRRFFTSHTSWIFRFSSPISRLGWEVFHRTNQVRPLTIITGLTLSAFGFPPQLSQWVRRFFTNSMLINPSVFLLSSPLG